MKDFYGVETQADYYEIEKVGKLTGTYGSGAVQTGAISLKPGTYLMSVKIGSETSVGNALTTGIFQARVHNGSTILIDGSHTGDSGYGMGFTITRVVKLDTTANVFALGQTSTPSNVNGGMRVELRIVKIN